MVHDCVTLIPEISGIRVRFCVMRAPNAKAGYSLCVIDVCTKGNPMKVPFKRESMIRLRRFILQPNDAQTAFISAAVRMTG